MKKRVLKRNRNFEPFFNQNNHDKIMAGRINQDKQLLDVLSTYGVDESKILKLEFHFYSIKKNNVLKLKEDLIKLNYQIDVCARQELGREIWHISGWSTPIQMGLLTVNQWSKMMCELAHTNSSRFDNWGTIPEQDEDFSGWDSFFE